MTTHPTQMIVGPVEWQAQPEDASAAARGISLGVTLGAALWAAAILALRALL
jgi:hypothetical protein